MRDCSCTPNMLHLGCPIHNAEAVTLVTQAIENGMLLARTPDYECELCGEQAETRPYGPHGEEVCFDCGMKDEDACKRAFCERMGIDPA